MAEFAKIFQMGDIHDGKSMLADPEASFSTAAAAAMATLPLDQQGYFQSACNAAKTIDDLPEPLADVVRQFM